MANLVKGGPDPLTLAFVLARIKLLQARGEKYRLPMAYELGRHGITGKVWATGAEGSPLIYELPAGTFRSPKEGEKALFYYVDETEEESE